MYEILPATTHIYRCSPATTHLPSNLKHVADPWTDGKAKAKSNSCLSPLPALVPVSIRCIASVSLALARIETFPDFGVLLRYSAILEFRGCTTRRLVWYDQVRIPKLKAMDGSFHAGTYLAFLPSSLLSSHPIHPILSLSSLYYGLTD